MRNQAPWVKAAPVRAAFAGKPVREQQDILRNTAHITPPARIRADAPVILFTHDEGKAKFATSTYELDLMASSGSIIVAADLRGLGETIDLMAVDGRRPLHRNDLKHYNSEYTNAIATMHLGESVVAQRAKDVLMLIEHASTEQRFKGHPITIEAYGKCMASALHAAILDTRVGTMRLNTAVPSWRKVILDNPTMWEQISYIVPRAALQYDLPNLLIALRNRRVNVTVN